ncbi:MAG TPA: sel1 repeat family protein [Deltaproteobacteria bacterium]|nr:sel1 repeat family protein [Deltaproteobacteria bacterium]
MWRTPILALAVSCLACLLATAIAAQTPGEARALALEALRLEFEYDSISATNAELERRFREACERGYNPACRRSTWIEEDHLDISVVHEVFRPSCEAGDWAACLVVGWSLDRLAVQEPTEEERDRIWRRAARLFKDQCDEGISTACNDYASFLYQNKGIVLSDPKPAIAIWEQACHQGEQAACTTLARLYLDGGPGVRTNRGTARSYAQSACNAGYPDACFLIGQLDDSRWSADQLDNYYGSLCAQGHKDACWTLARAYFDGIHPEPRPGRTQELFESACNLKHPRACFEAGRWEKDHNGDDTKAAELFGRACELQDAAGCSAQVSMILSGKVEATVRSAYSAFDVACDQRQSTEACAELGYYLLDRESRHRDAERGRELLERVCSDEGSNPEACLVLGRTYEEGVGGDRDRTEASTFYRWACSANQTEACMRRGKLLYEGTGVPMDHGEAVAMYGRACDGGQAEGCFWAGRIIEEGTYIPRDPRAASEWFVRGCDLESHHACNALGQLWEIGVDGTPDMKAARAAYERALEFGSLDAQRNLARLLWNGYGGRRERRRAKSLCREACQAGLAIACRGPAFL